MSMRLLTVLLPGFGSIEAAGGPQQDPSEKAGRRRRQPESEKPDGIAQAAGDIELREGDIPQQQRVDEGEEHHCRYPCSEKTGPEDRPDPLRHWARRVIEGWGSEVGHCALWVPGLGECDSDQT